MALSNNTVNKDIAEIYNGENGIITSYLKAVVLENATVSVDDNEVTLFATLVDDNGNLICENEGKINFTVNGVNVPAE